jgi:hypothetical protein
MPPRLARSAVRRLVLATAATVAAVVAVTAVVTPADAAPRQDELSIRGADVSWPQCPPGVGIAGRKGLGLPMPAATAQFVVIGLTNGPGFTRNPCLATQVDWARARGLHTAAYAVASFPTAWQLRHYAQAGPYSGATARSRLRNVGYAQARTTIATLRAVGLAVPHVWVDVESYPFRPWSRSLLANRAVVRGALQAYAEAGLTTGIYSTPLQFGQIAGRVGWGLPEWHTAGPLGRATALNRCTEVSFTGGPIVLSQWWTSRADHDLTCPAATSTAFRQFFTVPR